MSEKGLQGRIIYQEWCLLHSNHKSGLKVDIFGERKLYTTKIIPRTVSIIQQCRRQLRRAKAHFTSIDVPFGIWTTFKNSISPGLLQVHIGKMFYISAWFVFILNQESQSRESLQMSNQLQPRKTYACTSDTLKT